MYVQPGTANSSFVLKSVGHQNFPALDFLRGIAAICVVLYHFSSRVEFYGLFYHAYLAVDFFFCLSGFVLFNAYYRSINSRRLEFGDFLSMRLIRFMPLVVFGNLLAAGIDLFRPGAFGFSQHLQDIVVTFVLGCLLMPTLFRTTLEDTTYPLNGPVWSLFFELFANILFFFMARSRHCVVLLSVATVLSCLFLAYYVFKTGDLHFGPHVDYFAVGFLRVTASFCFGALLNYLRYDFIRINKWLAVLIFLLTVIMPKIHALPISSAYDFAIVMVVYPGIILASSNGADRRTDRIQTLFGNISFPVYTIHYALVRVIGTLVRGLHFGPEINLLIAFVCTACIALAGYGLFYYYDVPARAALKKALLPKPHVA
ncbi:acyltransferase [Allorhizobium sp. BGMRC 0089]|nr:acyltransferase [Allorhizobium sonneratiae]MCM2294051.1 acyltransferase [Allorhizobium sonneratiae]